MISSRHADADERLCGPGAWSAPATVVVPGPWRAARTRRMSATPMLSAAMDCTSASFSDVAITCCASKWATALTYSFKCMWQVPRYPYALPSPARSPTSFAIARHCVWYSMALQSPPATHTPCRGSRTPCPPPPGPPPPLQSPGPACGTL